MARGDRSLFVLGLALAAVDLSVLAAAEALGLTGAAPAGVSAAPAIDGVDPAWREVDVERLGARMAELFVATRDGLDGSGRVRVEHRRGGDDFVIAVATVAMPHAVVQGFPSRAYCLGCAEERCRFDPEVAAAMDAMVRAIPIDRVEAVVAALGPDRRGAPGVRVLVRGGASAGRVFRWNSVHTCLDEEEVTMPRQPPAYDRYDAAQCGAGDCVVAASGERVAIDSGDIDSNEELACLRARCLLAASPLDRVGRDRVVTELVAEVAFEEGGANRGGAIELSLSGIAAPSNRGAYRAFFRAFERGVGAAGGRRR